MAGTALGVALTDNDNLDFDLTSLDLLIMEEGLDETVHGLPSVLMGLVSPKPYPINIYNLDGRKESGLAGTLHPDGTFTALPQRNLPRAGEHWDEVTARMVPHTIIWDGGVGGCVEIPVDDDEPMRRMCDSSVIGPWPLHPPKPDRLVSVEGARAAALENERDARNSAGGIL